MYFSGIVLICLLHVKQGDFFGSQGMVVDADFVHAAIEISEIIFPCTDSQRLII